MKKNLGIKLVIVLLAIVIIGFIIVNNSRTVNIEEMVNTSIERYDYSLYVDSCCTVISQSSCDVAKQKYETLYKELKVVTNMQTQDLQPLVSDCINLYKRAFDAYCPLFIARANATFQSSIWQQRNSIRKESKALKMRTGCSIVYRDSLNNYIWYVDGYDNIISRLRRAESCVSPEDYACATFNKVYTSYPFSNLTDIQYRIQNAETAAKKHWRKNLYSKIDDLISRQSSIPMNDDDVQQYITDCRSLVLDIEKNMNTTKESEGWNVKITNLREAEKSIIRQYTNYKYY